MTKSPLLPVIGSLLLLTLLSACGGSSTSSATQSDESDSTALANNPAAAEANEQLQKFLEFFHTMKQEFPMVEYTMSSEMGSEHTEYYIADERLFMLHISKTGEGGYQEDFYASLDVEGPTYVHFGTETRSTFGIVGNASEEWWSLGLTNEYKPYVNGPGEPEKFDFLTDFNKHIAIIRSNYDRLKIEAGHYSMLYKLEDYQGEYGPSQLSENYRITDRFYKSNFLSPTRFDPVFIQSYMTWWYPLYENVDNKFIRREFCGEQETIKITEAMGVYLWDQQVFDNQDVVKTTHYIITAFQESEGDAFYATLELDEAGKQQAPITKTLVLTDDGALYVDGQLYTSEPDNYEHSSAPCPF